jgi:VWFA-related protein
MGLKSKYLLLLVLTAGLLSACEKKSNPILDDPDSGVVALSGVCTQVDITNMPKNRAFLSIADQNDAPVYKFAIGNFNVMEDDKPVVVTAVSKVDNNADPLSVVLVLDRSGSMGGSPTDELNIAASNFVDQLGPFDEAEIIDFSNDVRLVQAFTRDHTALKTAINNAQAGGGTALFDGIGTAANDLSDRNGRKFILAMTDGAENASITYTSRNSLIDFVNSKGLAAFTVGLGYLGAAEEADLQNIASDTGGRYFTAPNVTDLNTVFQKALVQFNNEVEVHFRTLSDGKRHMKVYMNYGRFTDSFEKVYGN